MNERIKELQKQCWDNQTNHLNAEKFAELIVNECVQICEAVAEASDHVSNASTDYIEGRQMGAYVCCNMIKKHFGVEE